MQPRSVSVRPRSNAPRKYRWEVWVYYPATAFAAGGPSQVLVDQFRFKFMAVFDATGRARALSAELVIHGKDGRIQDRRSYGNDPKGRG